MTTFACDENSNSAQVHSEKTESLDTWTPLNRNFVDSRSGSIRESCIVSPLEKRYLSDPIFPAEENSDENKSTRAWQVTW